MNVTVGLLCHDSSLAVVFVIVTRRNHIHCYLILHVEYCTCTCTCTVLCFVASSCILNFYCQTIVYAACTCTCHVQEHVHVHVGVFMLKPCVFTLLIRLHVLLYMYIHDFSVIWYMYFCCNRFTNKVLMWYRCTFYDWRYVYLCWFIAMFSDHISSLCTNMCWVCGPRPCNCD